MYFVPFTNHISPVAGTQSQNALFAEHDPEKLMHVIYSIYIF